MVDVQLYNSDGTLELNPKVSCDNTLDSTSNNPVENSVITSALNNKVIIRVWSEGGST